MAFYLTSRLNIAISKEIKVRVLVLGEYENPRKIRKTNESQYFVNGEAHRSVICRASIVIHVVSHYEVIL